MAKICTWTFLAMRGQLKLAWVGREVVPSPDVDIAAVASVAAVKAVQILMDHLWR